MAEILVLQHVTAETLGALESPIRLRGHRVRGVNFERDADARPSLDDSRALIVLGGPMNVEDRDRRAHLRHEIEIIGEAVSKKLPILGICLGAQLLAYALGAEVRRHRVSEIGWYELMSTTAGRSDPIFASFGGASPVFQWHSYTFDIPPGAVHLARTATCENQAFRYGDNAYGFQFHPEMDPASIERWLALPDYRDDLIAAGLGTDAAATLAAGEASLKKMETAAATMFEKFLDRVT